MTIVNDNSRIINKLEASLTVNARVVIYDHHMFIVQATCLIGDVSPSKGLFTCPISERNFEIS